MQNAAAVIYTSGLDFMHSNKPAALREIVFRPMIDWVNEALDSAGISERCYVINDSEEDVKKYTGEYPVFMREKESGHPIFSAKEWIKNHSSENFLVVSAEAVFTNPDVLKAAFERHTSSNEKLTVIASAGRESFIKELSQSAFWITKTFFAEVSEKADGEAVKLFGSLSNVRTKATKSGADMAYAVLEDLTGDIELVRPRFETSCLNTPNGLS